MAIHCFLTWSAFQTILPIASARYITIHVTATCHRGTPPSFCQDMQQTRPRSLNRCFNTEEEIASAQSRATDSAHAHAHARCKGVERSRVRGQPSFSSGRNRTDKCAQSQERDSAEEATHATQCANLDPFLETTQLSTVGVSIVLWKVIFWWVCFFSRIPSKDTYSASITSSFDLKYTLGERIRIFLLLAKDFIQ